MLCRWDGQAFVPLRKQLGKVLVAGKIYDVDAREERSRASHGHYFATLAEAHRNLPESIADRFPTPDELRKWALINTGFSDVRSIACASAADAKRVAGFVAAFDRSAVIVTKKNTAIVYTAKSQSLRAMSAKEFQKSKEAVLDFISAMIEVEKEQLEAQAKRLA